MVATDLPEGWLSNAEAEVLAELARDKVCLEIGSWLGRSTVAMAQVAKRVVAVDHHHGPPYDGEGSTFGRFMANLEAFGVADKVVPFLAGFEIAGPLLRPGIFDLAFVDGAHDYESCLRDGRLAWSLVHAGGVVVFHDYFDYTTGGPGQDGVHKAVDELCIRWSVKFRNPAGSLAIVDRRVA